MGASDWNYCTPYQPDLNAALRTLRERVFAEGAYHWPPESDFTPEHMRRPRPRTLEELDAAFEDDWQVQEAGTHSILDMERVIGPDDLPEPGTVQPVSPDDARLLAGTEQLTRAHLDAVWELADERWVGRCVVLHDDEGRPSEVCFWGYSGD